MIRFLRWLFFRERKPVRYECEFCLGIFYSSATLSHEEFPCLCERRFISS